MKNLLNRLTKISLLMLLLVDRTPNFGILANATYGENTKFELHFDTNGSTNLGVGDGIYEHHFYNETESSWFTNWNLSLGSNADSLAAAYGITPQTVAGKTFTGFYVAKIDYKNGDGNPADIDGANDLNFIGILATFASNASPVTIGDDIDLNEGATHIGTMVASDADTDALTWIITNQPNHGTLVFNASTGEYTYTHDGSEGNDDEFEFKVKDEHGAYSNISTVDFDITNINDAPTANNDAYTVDEDSSLPSTSSRNVLGNDDDVDDDDDDLIAVLVSSTSNGTLSLNTNGRFSYTPNANFFGTDSFTYQAKDPHDALSNIATVTITVRPRNDNPVAVADEYTTAEDTPLNVLVPGVLANDTSIDGDTLSAIFISGPSHGSLTLNSNGSFVYTPIAEYNGPDSFTYKANDGSNSNVVTVSITVTLVNDSPVASDGSFSVDEGGTYIGGAIASDNDSPTLIYSIVGGGNTTNGSVVIDPNTGAFTYIHNGSETITDSFEFSVSDGNTSDTGLITITVNPINDAPVAVEDAYSLDEDTSLTTTLVNGVLLNDTDVDSTSLTAVLVTNVTSGTLTLNTDGTFTYTPNANFFGEDFFEYKANDGALNSNVVKVTLTVNNVNDAPIAQDGSFTVLEGATYLGNALGSDLDSASLTYAVVGSGTTTNGTIVVNADGSFTYIHNGSETLSDSFEFTVSDGVLSDTGLFTITVTPVNDAPVANDDSYNTNEDQTITVNAASGVLSNDTDAEGNPLTATKLTNPAHGTLLYFNANGSFRYRPNTNYNGPDSFTYKTTDSNGAISTATVTINVAPVNDRPDADADSFITNEDTLLNFTVGDLLDNDSDADNDVLTITSFTQPSAGSLVLVGNTFTFTPNLNYFGLTGFSYTINDGNGGSDSTTVFITVRPINDSPIAVDDVYNTNEDQTLVISTYSAGLLPNDSDVDNLVLLTDLAAGGDPLNGTVTVNLNGTFTYTPNANFTGVDTFTYRVRDLLGGSDTATVTINVSSINDGPVAVNDSFSLGEDTQLDVILPGILVNDTDVENDALTIALDTNVMNGSLTLNADGSFTYVPNADFNGVDTFTYHVNDGEFDSNIATVTLEVIAVNDAPVANPLAFIVPNAGSSTGLLTASDVDIPADILTFSLLTPATNGTVTVSPTGEYTYTHNGSATLSDTFEFSVTDGLLTSTATVTITVLAINLSPVAIPQTLSVITGGTGSGTVSGTDPEGAALVFSLLSGTANGSLVFNADGTFTYTHNGGTTTSDSFLFEVFDGVHTSNATVSITIIPPLVPPTPPTPNGAPVVVDGTLSAPFEGSVDGTATGTDPDGDPLTFNLLTGPTNGTIVFNPDGTFTYTPDAGFSGTDSFTFNANDGTDDSNVGTYTLNVLEEEVNVVTPETPLAAINNDWMMWLLALLAGLLLFLLAFLRPNMKYILTDKANNQKVVRRRLSKPDEKTMVVELSDKDLVEIQTIEVEFFKRLAKNCGGVTVNFQLNGKVIHSVTIPEGIDDSFETLIRL